MRFFDPHIHMTSRTTNDYEALYASGVRALVEPAFWLGQPRTNVGSFIDYFDALLGWERFRAAQFGIRHYSWLCINAKEAENVGLSREVIALIPQFLDRPNVLGIGEIGELGAAVVGQRPVGTVEGTGGEPARQPRRHLGQRRHRVRVERHQRHLAPVAGEELRHPRLELAVATSRSDAGKRLVDLYPRYRVPLELTGKEFAVLRYLMTRPDHLVSAEELLEHVWDENADPFTQTVRVTVGTLRRKLTVHTEPQLLETVTGRGYRLRAGEPVDLPA